MQIRCQVCGQLNRVGTLAPGYAARCGRCASVIHQHRRGAVMRTLLYSAAALVLYVPANILPILSMDKFGMHSQNTILSGCAELFRNGYWGVGAVVFFASVFVPLFKLTALFYLACTHRSPSHRSYKTRLYRFVHAIGPWSMLDVFLVAVLVSLVKLGDLASVSPQPGLVAFTAVVVLTMLASASFDPRLIWHTQVRARDG